MNLYIHQLPGYHWDGDGLTGDGLTAVVSGSAVYLLSGLFIRDAPKSKFLVESENEKTKPSKEIILVIISTISSMAMTEH